MKYSKHFFEPRWSNWKLKFACILERELSSIKIVKNVIPIYL